jgi:hypothetical protein
MYGGDDADQKVEAYAVAGLEAVPDRFTTNTRHMRLAVGLIGKRVVQVVGQLAVDADRLQPLEDRVSGTFEHRSLISWPQALGFGLFVFSYRLPATG